MIETIIAIPVIILFALTIVLVYAIASIALIYSVKKIYVMLTSKRKKPSQ